MHALANTHTHTVTHTDTRIHIHTRAHRYSQSKNIAPVSYSTGNIKGLYNTMEEGEEEARREKGRTIW